LERKVRGLVLNVSGPQFIDYGFDITKGSGTVIESVTTPLTTPPARKFLRLYLDETP
jgi:hypothetical protein